MTIDEAIKNEEEVAEENQRVVDTGIVFDDVTIDMLYCDDTEVIEEHLANYQRCAEEHRQLAEWLKDYKRLLEQRSYDGLYKKLLEDYYEEMFPNHCKQQSISVYKSLPKDGEEILFITKPGVIHRGVYHNDKTDNPWYSFMIDYRVWNSVVIAWMPLSEPYKTESEE